MENRDTICLLKECDAGCKMALESFQEVMDRIQDPKLRSLVTESKSHHEKLCDEIHKELSSYDRSEKEPSMMAVGMSWMKTNMKMLMNDNDATVADLLTDGCNMGIKTLNKYLNQYSVADQTSKQLCQKLIDIEETLREDLHPYL